MSIDWDEEKTKWREVVATYCDAILSGEKVAGKMVRQAVQRHRRDLQRVKNKDYPYTFNEDKAVQAIKFFSFLKHSDGEYAGKAFALYPWQAFVVWCLFGWVSKATGFRKFRHAYLSLGRGNGKTPFGAALLLLVFCFDSPLEARAECYTAATKRDQANLAFRQIQSYISGCPSLQKYVNVLTHNISIPLNGSSLVKLTSDGKTADGLNIHGLLRDELHAWTETHREFLEKLNTAMGKRRQPLAIDITTAGSEESELWQETYDYAVVAVDPDNEVDADDTFVMCFEMDDEDDECDEVAWIKGNPMLEFGIVKIDYLRKLAERAKHDPLKRAELRRYHCNKLTMSTSRPLVEAWAKGAATLPDLVGRACYAGFDWGWRDDLAAFGMVFPLDWTEVDGEHKRRYALLCDIWVCAHGQRNLTREPWRTWINEGWVIATESEWTDTRAIYQSLEQRQKTYTIRSLAFDPNNAREFGSTCVNEYGLNTFEMFQTCRKYNEPVRELIAALNEGRIVHGGNPVLDWCATNVVMKEDPEGLVMPWKRRSKDKIDPIVAILMGLSEAMFGEKKKPSVYERRGPIVG